MVLKKIDLQNFRLHRNTNLDFSDKLNLIIGGNGQGKTTILEAVYYLCTTKNLNFASEKDVVTFGERGFNTEGVFTDLTESKLQIFYDGEQNKKNFFLNEKQIFKSSDVIGRFPVVTLIQADHSITLGSPLERRRFVDSVISQASHSYLETLLEYNKTLRQRASFLSIFRDTNKAETRTQLDAWTEILINTGTEIIKQRKRFIEEFNDFMQHTYEKLIDSIEQPRIEYKTIGNNNITEENIKKMFTEEINNVIDEEVRRIQNLIGPHRDDFIFYINEKELKRFGSQGQHKTFQVALRFAQFFYLADKIGRTPIFLMDDVFGELDKYRAEKISAYLPEVGQTFITTTDFTKMEELNLVEGNKIIKVENGKAI